MCLYIANIIPFTFLLHYFSGGRDTPYTHKHTSTIITLISSFYNVLIWGDI